MFSFINEVPELRNPSLRYFILSDFFHDGTVHDFSIEKEGNLRIKLSSHSEWQKDYNLYSYTSNMPEYKHIFDEKYMYSLLFTGCVFFNYEVANTSDDSEFQYFSAHLKNTALLSRFKKNLKKELYHVRVELSLGGYFDIIFSNFSIEKIRGNIKLPSRVKTIQAFKLPEKIKRKNIAEIRKIATKGSFWEKYFTIPFLTLTKDKEALKIALQNLKSKEDDIKTLAIFALGEVGNSSVIPTLARLYKKTPEPLYRRNIQDSIDKIVYRLE